ncbi:MAG TPA: BlaI/MecI/CopY family transcriptional regulator [Gammaproteobacteria bacterium]|nr:BlaI/MecI/CopY family transcriptional regulator [Gammaproteobacteria bacterium]
MNQALHAKLGRRESQIMDIVYRDGEATAESVREALPAPQPSNSSVRSMLRLLEDKGHLEHRRDGRRFIYRPSVPAKRARRSALNHLVDTFFGGSTQTAVATLLSMRASKLSEAELTELSELINRAKHKESK